MISLYDFIDESRKRNSLEDIAIPEFILNNLKYDLFDWQKEAFKYFLFNEKTRDEKSVLHLLFNMATGSGKTLLMAALILYYYNKGYRHFLFFVNQNNIIDKTENNFINCLHSKYLYKDKIIIEDKTVRIKKVENFSNIPNLEHIEIKFTSIQQLYNDIHVERENRTTLTDIQSKDIVMLADEAHHLNANTKKVPIQDDLLETKLSGTADEREKKGWEHTVMKLLLNKKEYKKTTYLPDNKNILLEFTATLPDNKNVAEKYKDIIIYKFGLAKFLRAGYTKEINLISSNLNKKERVLQALVFQWYRHEIALKYDVHNFKAVILFRSKYIEDSKQDHQEFIGWMDNLVGSDFDFMQTISSELFSPQQLTILEMGKMRTQRLLEYINSNDISFAKIADWIKNNYAERNIIITNSKTNKSTETEKTSEAQERLLNSLEDKNNHIRAIFTVKRLTEGWDVLNLFDIVRLYKSQNVGGSDKKTPRTTTEEMQLIGRGVRYFPFSYKDKLTNKRKFDEDLDHELRILEELFYYTYDEKSRYIAHLKKELRKEGYITDDKEQEVKTFNLKPEFKQTKFYKKTKVWYNKLEDNPEGKQKKLKDIEKDSFPTYKIHSLMQTETQAIGERRHYSTSANNIYVDKVPEKIRDLEKHIFLKAVNIRAKQEGSLYRFGEIQKSFNILKIDELQSKIFYDEKYQLLLEIENRDFCEVKNSHRLKATLKFLGHIEKELKTVPPKRGGGFIPGNFADIFGKEKSKVVKTAGKEESMNLWTNTLKNADWYPLNSFYGTSEEISLVDFVKGELERLKENYEEIRLIRNEEIYKIFDFEHGRGFQPDFLLFLKSKKHKDKKEISDCFYQIFIEPKGELFFVEDKGDFGREAWKDDFLAEISKRYGSSDKLLIAQNDKYQLIGLPLYNTKHNDKFVKHFNQLTNSHQFNNPLLDDN